MNIDTLLAAACKPFDGKGFIEWLDESAILLLDLKVHQTDRGITALRSRCWSLQQTLGIMRDHGIGKPAELDKMRAQVAELDDALFELGRALQRAAMPIAHVVMSKPATMYKTPGIQYIDKPNTV